MNRGTLGKVVLPVVPSGVVWEYLGATAPPGWLLADGSAVSRAQYPALFQAIGTLHGAGNGSTTFNLPNRKGRLGVGVDAGQTEFVSVGTVGGSKSSTASHVHDMGSHTHARTAGGASEGTSIVWGNVSRQGVGASGSQTGESNGHTHSMQTVGLGGGAADGLQGYSLTGHKGVQTTDRGGELLYGGTIGGCCLTSNNSAYGDHDHQLENHSHPLEGHTHAAGSHTHADSFGGANTNTTGDSSVVQATNGNLQPYIVVNYIVKV